MTKQEKTNEYFRHWREKQLMNGFKIHSYWIHVRLVDEVKDFIKRRTEELNLK